MLSACGLGWCFVRCTPSLTPQPHMSPQCPPGRAIWWPGMVVTLVQLISAHVLLSAIDHLEFSRILCNSPSSYFICNPQIPPIPPAQSPNSLTPLPWAPYTPAIPWCTPDTLHPCQPQCPLAPPTISQNSHPKAPVASQHWKTNKVVWFLICNPQCPWHPLQPCWPPEGI